ncbi:MAG: HEAT repeat domain-containing protein [Deltaproteobacteria bacterium]|nr:HEAT repeat domain-containing protein [Deltaproteobacteria bacterium]
MSTVPRGKPRGSPVVRKALEASTQEGKAESLIRILVGDDLPAAMEAVDALAALGPSVVPRLVSEMQRARNNWLIGGALAKMGPVAVDPLLELLEEADEGTAVDCIYLLGELQDRRAVPTLTRFLDDPRERVRVYAVTSLLQVGGDRAVEAVLTRMTREGKGISSFIVESLLRHGEKSAEPLIRSLNHPDPRVRAEVAFLLGRLEDARAIEPLLGLLQDPEPRVRRNAVFALGALNRAGQESPYVIDRLVRVLADPAEDVSSAAREALVRYGERVVPVLLARCREGSGAERLASINALREIGSREAEPVMIELLGHRDRNVRIAAVAALMVLGSKASVEPLLAALRDEDMRWFASLALEKVGPENPEIFLRVAPNDPSMALRTEILARLGSKVVPALCQYLRGDVAGKKVLALWVLGEIGDGTAATDVAGLLDDQGLGWLAGRTLRKLGDAGLEELRRYAANPRNEVGALQAIDALALFEDERALQALEQCVTGRIPRRARVRAAVRLSMLGEPETVDRLRTYLETDGQGLWPDVEAALRAERQIR